MTYLKNPQGRLILSANHIGNSQDIPPRAFIWLKEADLIVFEEDRPARQALKACGIERPYLKFNEHYQKDSFTAIEKALREGKTVSYMSDQGIGNIADPGQKLLELAYKIKAKVQIIPGPSSITAAISACPFDFTQFHFLGFPPQKTELRSGFFQNALGMSAPVIILETPYRLSQTIEQLALLESSRRGFLAIDITGPNELYLLDKFSQLKEQIAGLKENFVLIIEGKRQEKDAKRRQRSPGLVKKR